MPKKVVVDEERAEKQALDQCIFYKVMNSPYKCKGCGKPVLEKWTSCPSCKSEEMVKDE